ncbi:unnamed protein product, partial [Effrenium voratum]
VNYYSFGDLLQVPCFLSGALAVPPLLHICQPEVKLTAALMQRTVLSLSVAILLSSIGFPRELLPILYVARIMVGTFCMDGNLTNRINACLAPLYVCSNWMQDEHATELQLMFMIIAEAFFCSVTALTLATLNYKEYQLALASLRLQAKVEEVEEAERSGGAAQRLLSVTCDAFARLNDDLRIATASRGLLDILMCGFGNGCRLEGVPFIRYVASNDQERFKDFLVESAKEDAPPRSIHLDMKDSGGITFKAELFHVSVPSLKSDAKEHLIGISQEHAEKELMNHSIAQHDHFPVADMRHLLGQRMEKERPMSRLRPEKHADSKSEGGGSRLSASHSSKSSRTTSLVKLRMLRKVELVIDLDSLDDDFPLKSVTLCFAQSEDCPKEALPNLLEWIKPSYREKVFNWVQDNANASHAGQKCQETAVRGVKFFSPLSSAKTILSGEIFATKVPDEDPEEDNDEGSNESIANAVAGGMVKDGLCSAPYFYSGTCPFKMNLLNYTQGMKATFAANCNAQWPLASRYMNKPQPTPARYPSHAPGQPPAWQCTRNFNRTCPDGFNFDGAMCHEDGSYINPSMTNCAHFDARRWTNQMKEAFGEHCHVWWPCKASQRSGTQNLRNGPVQAALLLLEPPETQKRKDAQFADFL